MLVFAPQSSYAAKKDEAWSWDGLMAEVSSLSTLSEAAEYRDHIKLTRLRHLPPAWQEPLWDACEAREDELKAAAKSRSLDEQFRRAMEKD